jgi:hypothetical protein
LKDRDVRIWIQLNERYVGTVVKASTRVLMKRAAPAGK